MSSPPPMPRLEHPKSTESPEDALRRAHSTYTELNPSSLNAYQSSCMYLPGGNTRTVLHANPFPMTFTSGDGCTLTSLDGHTYIDFLGEYTAGIYGHNNATIQAAISEALSRGWSLGGNNLYEKELAKLVCERFTPTMELVRFTNSGTEANMMAVATAIARTDRKKILVFEGGYHGATISFRSSPAGPSNKSVNLPHEWVIGKYNDIGRTEAILSALPPNSLAAILVEPMLGSAGAIPGSAPFLQYLRSYASSHGALLIFDEVMTSRISYRGLGHKLGISPDLMTLGKWVGGGMSFGAFGGRREIMEMYDPRKSGGLAHAGTFNNNVISMAAGCAGCKILDEETTDRLNELGERLKEMVTTVIDEKLYPGAPEADGVHCESSKAPHPTNTNPASSTTTNGTTKNNPPIYTSGIGSILAIHFPPSSPPNLHSLFYHHMLSRNIYLAENGFMALNIELGMPEVERFVEATGEFVERFRDAILGGWG